MGQALMCALLLALCAVAGTVMAAQALISRRRLRRELEALMRPDTTL